MSIGNTNTQTMTQNSSKLPSSYTVPDPYGLFGAEHHNQGAKSNCTSHSFALMVEMQLSTHFKERTLIDVDDLWDKQKRFGTATEERGDFADGPFIIASTHGVRFRTDSGKTGTLFMPGTSRVENGITVYEGGTIKMDNPVTMRIFNFFRQNKKQEKPMTKYQLKAQAYKKDLELLFSETRRTLNSGSLFRVELEVEQAGIGSEVYDSVKNISGIQIDFHDRAKEDSGLPKIDERHREFLNSQRPLGAGAPYWEAFAVLQHGVVISAQFLWPWVVKHIAEDIDQKAWDAVKEIVKHITRKLSNRKDISTKDVVLKMHYPEGIQYGVALIFQEGLSAEEVETAFMLLRTTEVNLPEPKLPGPSVVVIRYNVTKSTWEEDAS